MIVKVQLLKLLIFFTSVSANSRSKGGVELDVLAVATTMVTWQPRLSITEASSGEGVAVRVG
jgi:hypothetical protein